MPKKDKSQTPKKTFKSFMLKTLFKRLPIIIGFALFFMILSFKILERFPEPLKQGIAEYFTLNTPYVAEIETLDRINFFPSLYVGISNMILREKDNVAITHLEMEKAKIHVPFLTKFTHAREVYDLGIIGLKADAGIMTPQAIEIETLGFVDSLDQGSSLSNLIIAGSYAEQPMRFTADVTKKKTLFGNKVYKFENVMPFTFDIAGVSLSGNFVYLYDKMAIQNAVISVADNQFNLKDSFIVENQQLVTDNPIYCLLGHDFKAETTLCTQYIDTKTQE
ncbi:MAG: hypothetical protein GW903_08135 [Alphaproteobacteria bacterium]|nr:hypothetical protein [Alphaproteobacteria bacterium]NCQ88820.1 hypothetical protein [Alphaproteobacteria bacterium]NCT07257.1 hypothetical protein [Alphaproteobacteria bacterium]